MSSLTEPGIVGIAYGNNEKSDLMFHGESHWMVKFVIGYMEATHNKPLKAIVDYM